MATEAEAEAILPGSGAAAAAGVTRTSKLRLYVTLPDGACAGVLASPLMPVSVFISLWLIISLQNIRRSCQQPTKTRDSCTN